MVKASPASTFIVIEAEFLLEFLIVALDPPAQFGSFDEPSRGPCPPPRSRASIWSARFRPAAIRRATTLRHRAANANSRDARAEPARRRSGNEAFCRRLRARRRPARRQPAATWRVAWPTEAGSARRAASASGVDLARSRPWAGADRLPAAKAGPTTERRRHKSGPSRQRRSERRVDPVTGVRQHHPFRHAPRRARRGSGRARFAVWS